MPRTQHRVRRRPGMRWAAAALSAGLSLTASLLLTPETLAAPTAAMSSPEYQFVAMINADRQTNGLPGLALNGVLSNIARQRSQQMFNTGIFSHYDGSGTLSFARMLDSVRFPYLLAGENLAKNNYRDLMQSLEIANSGLMKSPTHRANILNRAFNEVGVGIVGPDLTGQFYYTEIFAQV